MPAKCDRCGQPSYVKYVKPNPGIICDKCEDQDRKRKDVLDVWEIIKYRNRQWRRTMPPALILTTSTDFSSARPTLPD
jgi:hypothetical protein